MVTFALAVPLPAFAQSAETAFPCIAPSGAEVADADQFAQDLMVAGSAVLDTSTCTQEALDQAIESGGDALSTAINPVSQSAPEAAEEPVVEASVVEVEEPAAEAEEPAAEVDAVEPVVPVEETVEADEPVQADAQVVEEIAPAEDTPSVEETTAPAEDVPVETAPVEEAPVAEAITSESPDAVDETPVEAEESAEPLDPAATDTAPSSQPAATQAGEAGGEVVTDEERQATAAANVETQPEPSAAATSTDDEVTAEVSTQTITEEDVRTSDQDFATSINAETKAASQTQDNGNNLSNFEKALLLGLGAVVVGSVLNNGDQVVSNSGDRVVIERDGELRVLKNDDELLQRPGAQVQTQTFQDGSTRNVVTYDDDSQIITIKSRDGTVLRRTMMRASDGREVVLFDDTRKIEAVDFGSLPALESLEAQQRQQSGSLEAALQRASFTDVGRQFSLQQIRDYKRVRALAPQVELEAVIFATGSAAIDPTQAEALRDLGLAMRDVIENDPSSVFLIEGHTDAVGAASYNLALSDRRAETVALALTEYFAVPPQNLITQGYGEADLKVMVVTNERANRRAVVRNISGLLN